MANGSKQLSNPFSTGSGGARFEANIQATFVTLMLSGGYAPCLPSWPIAEIKLQGMVAGYATDDLIVFIQSPANNERRSLLGQVKHSIAITASSKIFGEVIQAAWNDFNNPTVFSKGKDVIALITGPISATDTDGVNGLLDQARHTRDADEFLTQIARANFCSDNTRNKLEAFRSQLKKANNDEDVPADELFEFLKHFHLLGYDLARKGSAVSSLLQSHIAQFNKEIPDKIWDQIINKVQDFNQNAGTITLETLPEDLVEHFREPTITYIPKELTTEDAAPPKPPAVEPPTDWNQHTLAQKLAMASLIGNWNEQHEADKEIITRIVGENYSDWIAELRGLLQHSDCPLSFNNGAWNIKDRGECWQTLGSRIFDENLDSLKTVAVEVLRLNDPSFELPADERYAAAIHGKELPHSSILRQGLAETLALIGSRPAHLTNCSQGKAETTALLAIREIFDEADWVLWGSLNSLLPAVAESCPNEFLTAVENGVNLSPSPFEVLFEQEDTGVFGRNYITGLLWALEGIAWNEVYLTRTTVVLAELASHDPGGNWANRPINSLTDIFLPWLPHTLASVEKRQVALKTICAEQPDVGWKLLESLLPSQHSTTTGTHKPEWREVIPEDWGKGTTNVEYWDQTRFCASLIVEQAGFDLKKLTALAGNFDHLPSPAFEKLRDRLITDECTNLPEEERMPIWAALRKLIAHHRRFPDADWSLGNEFLLPIENAVELLAPTSPHLLYKRLFSDADAYLYEGDGDWENEQDKLFDIRSNAVGEIFSEGGLPLVLEFMKTVENPYLVGESLAAMNMQEFDRELLPLLLNMNDHKQWSFVSAYAWRRRLMGDWQWFDDFDKSGWDSKHIALLLCALPFEKKAWDRAQDLLGEDEGEYWKNTYANTFQSNDPIEYALKKLLEFGRPSAAIQGFRRTLSKKQEINTDLACDALLALVASDEPVKQIDTYSITETIKALQNATATDQDKLFQVEWAYVTLLDRNSGASPKTLEYKLASDPSFFCELIQLIYRAEGTDREDEPSEQRRNLATNAYRLLSAWKTVPGVQNDGEFDPDSFLPWLKDMEEIVKTSGHYNVAMSQLGGTLVHSPGVQGGLWIHPIIADALNHRDRSSLRDGYGTGTRNLRGVHTVDPEAKPERALAKKYRQHAEDVENAGYQRLAVTLRDVANSYDRDAERILTNNRYI